MTCTKMINIIYKIIKMLHFKDGMFKLVVNNMFCTIYIGFYVHCMCKITSDSKNQNTGVPIPSTLIQPNHQFQQSLWV